MTDKLWSVACDYHTGYPDAGCPDCDYLAGPAPETLDEDEDDGESRDERISRAVAALGATDLGDDRWAYYADETSSWWIVNGDDLESYCDYLDDPDPAISGDAYSHWCAGTNAEEMPEGWEPGVDDGS